MAAALKKPSMPALGWWLMAVGTYRIMYTLSCFFGYASLCSATLSEIKMTDAHGRTAAMWTLLSCTLCFLCAFNLSSKPLYAATCLSFAYVVGYLTVEYAVYHTISASASVARSTMVVAGISMVWMLLQWNSRGHGRPSPRGATYKQP